MTASPPEPPKPANPSPTATGSTPAVVARPVAPVARPAAKPSGNGPLVVLSLLALLVAVGSTAVSVYALDQARQASTRANEARSVADRAAPSTAAPRPVTTPSRPATTPTATPSKGPTFIAELVRAGLKVQAPPSKCASVYVDIDKMTVGDLTGHEFYVSNCVGPLSVHVDRTSGAVPTPNNPTAEVCAAQITSETAGSELILPIVNGLTFCLLTNKADAAQQGIPQRIAIVEVREVGADNSITVAVSTYRVPGTA